MSHGPRGQFVWLVLASALMGAWCPPLASASIITDVFAVQTGGGGPLTGPAPLLGSFSYSSSIVAPGRTVVGAHLLTSLNFTLNGTVFNTSNAGSAFISFDPTGNLSEILFGSDCNAGLGFCAAPPGQNSWSFSYGLTNTNTGQWGYSLPGLPTNYGGTASLAAVSSRGVIEAFAIQPDSGPLVGSAPLLGSFSYSPGIVAPGQTVVGAHLLTSLNFTLNGTVFNTSNAGSAFISFDPTGNLSEILFGSDCNAGLGFCATPPGQNSWSFGYGLTNTNTGEGAYSLPGLSSNYGGYGSLGIVPTFATVPPTTPSVPEPSALTLFAMGLLGIALAGRRRCECVRNAK